MANELPRPSDYDNNDEVIITALNSKGKALDIRSYIVLYQAESDDSDEAILIRTVININGDFAERLSFVAGLYSLFRTCKSHLNNDVRADNEHGHDNLPCDYRD